MLNSVAFQGRLVRDIEVKETQGGIKYARFTLAWSEKYKENERTCFLPCRAWRNTADFMEKYFSAKGTEMLVEGQLETLEWEKDGSKHSMIMLNVDQVHFCGKRQDAAQAAQTPPAAQTAAYEPADEEELPF